MNRRCVALRDDPQYGKLGAGSNNKPVLAELDCGRPSASDGHAVSTLLVSVFVVTPDSIGLLPL